MILQTYTGKIDLTRPDPDDVNIVDVARHLSRIFRFTGATDLTVAQHSILCAQQAFPEHAFAALMHDAHEAYMGDLTSPLKRSIVSYATLGNSGIDFVERELKRAVRTRFGLPMQLPIEVHRIDMRMLQTERLQLLYFMEWEQLRGVEPYDIKIECWPPAEAESRFLREYVRLGGPGEVLEVVEADETGLWERL